MFLRVSFLCPAALLAGLLPSAATAQRLHLIPEPRQVTPKGDVALTGGVDVVCRACDAEDTFAANDLREALTERGVPVRNAGGFRIVLERLGSHADPKFTPAMQAEGYTITAAANSLTLTGASAAGVFYAAQTARQLVEMLPGKGAVVHTADIVDWPAMRYRGLHDDLSRGPVDTLEFQKKLVRTLASFKGNVYSPYFEHTQQYASNPLPAPPGGSISPDDARALVAYARQFHVTVIPEQEAFGHLHHDLIFEQYNNLAETPHGSVLAPGQPGSIQTIQQMFSELAQLYPGPFLHIGSDETVELGQGQTKAAVDKQGLGPVYLDYLERINTALRPLDRRLLFWGDIAQDVPDLLKTMPAEFKKDTIAVAWWYNPRPAGFARYLTPFTNAGFETWVASGINNWNRVYPDWNDALPNIQGFVRDGQKLGSTGMLNTIWYDDGEALASNNWYGILFGAAAGWQPGESSITDFQASYGPVFHGDTTGKLNQAQQEIMAAHALLRAQIKGDASNGLFWIDPWSKDGQKLAEKIRPCTHELRLHAERALTLIAEARAAYPAPASAEIDAPRPYDPTHRLPSAATSLREPDAIDALELGARRIDFIGLKFQLADEMANGYAHAQLDAASTDRKVRGRVIYDLADIRGVNGKMEDIGDGYALLRELYQQLWLRTNRTYALRPVLAHFDYTLNLWYSRMDKLRTAQRQWDDSRTLPRAEDVGIPGPVSPQTSSPVAAPPPAL